MFLRLCAVCALTLLLSACGGTGNEPSNSEKSLSSNQGTKGPSLQSAPPQKDKKQPSAKPPQPPTTRKEPADSPPDPGLEPPKLTFAPSSGLPADEDKDIVDSFRQKGWSPETRTRPYDLRKQFSLKLSFSDRPLTEKEYELIASAQSLQFVDFSDSQLADEGLQILSAMKQLEGIVVRGKNVTAAGLKHLQQSESLNEVTLKFTRKVTEDGVESLAGIPQLQAVQILGMRLTGEALGAFADTPHLIELTLDSVNGFTDAGMKNLVGLKKLQRLHLELTPNAGLSSSGIRSLVDQRLPPHFHINGSLIDDDLLASLVTQGWLFNPGVEGKPGSPKEVSILSLAESKVTDKGFEELLSCINAEHLLLSNCGIGDESIKKLGTFTKISTLELNGTKVSGDGLDLIVHCPITRINLGDLQLKESAFRAAGKMKQLDYISISHSKFQNAWLAHLAELTKLTGLDISRTTLNDAGAAHLARIKSLEGITAAGTKIGDQGLAALLLLPKLQSIDINDTSVTKAGFAKAKKAYPKIRITHFGFDR